MKLFYRGKDGGPESTVTGYWLIEWKPLFSIALLKFEDGTRDAFHTHAFNSVSWLLSGKFVEEVLNNGNILHRPSILPIITKRDRFHRVWSVGTSWALTFRGPWESWWMEYRPKENRLVTLGIGRVEL